MGCRWWLGTLSAGRLKVMVGLCSPRELMVGLETVGPLGRLVGIARRGSGTLELGWQVVAMVLRGLSRLVVLERRSFV